MRILHVAPTYAPAYRYGGPIQSTHTLNKHLARAGAEVEVFTTAIDGPDDLDVPLASPVTIDGVRVRYFRPGCSLLARKWFYAPDMRRALMERTGQFDIVHITSVFLSASTLAARAARAATTPYVISPHGALMAAPLLKSVFKKRAYLRLIERRNLESAAALHFVSEAEAEDFERLGLRIKKTLVIPNGLDPESLPPGDPVEFRKRFGIPASGKIVLFLGRLAPGKGLDVLIPAFALLARKVPDSVLVIAGGGEGDHLKEARRLADASGAGERVIFTGPLNMNSAERSAAYQAASVFASPSVSENFGMAVAEAMHFGVPVVVSPGVGLAPQVRRRGAGIVAERRADAFAKAIEAVLGAPEAAEEMGRKGRAASAEFSVARVAAAMQEAYQDLITGSSENQ